MSEFRSMREVLPGDRVDRSPLGQIAERAVILELFDRLPDRLTGKDNPRLLPVELREREPEGDEARRKPLLEVVLMAADPSYADLVQGSPLESLVRDTVEDQTGRRPELTVQTTGMVRLREIYRILSAELPSQ